MNCPSRTEEPEGTGFNQNPSSLSADLTTRNDLNGIANARVLRRIASSGVKSVVEHEPDEIAARKQETAEMAEVALTSVSSHVGQRPAMSSFGGEGADGEPMGAFGVSKEWIMRLRKVLMHFGKFVGPGFMVWKTSRI
jgi:metal iron transporter